MAKVRSARRIGVVLVAFAALALGGCATGSAGGSMGPDARLDGEWRLVSASDETGSISLANTYFTLNIPKRAAATGRAACLDYAARIIGKPGVVFVEVTRRTVAVCSLPSLSSVDDRYLAALEASQLASVTATRLTLASTSTKLEFTRAPSVPVTLLEDVPWTVGTQSFAELGDGTEVQQRYGSLLFSGSHRFALNVGTCPQVSGVWSAEDGLVVLGAIKDEVAKCVNDVDAVTRNEMMLTLNGGFLPTATTKHLRLENVRTLTVLALSTNLR